MLCRALRYLGERITTEVPAFKLTRIKSKEVVSHKSLLYQTSYPKPATNVWKLKKDVRNDATGDVFIQYKQPTLGCYQ